MSKNKWRSLIEVKLEEELYKQMHNDWIRINGCGNPNCVICNGLIKKEEISPDWKGDPDHPNRWDGW